MNTLMLFIMLAIPIAVSAEERKIEDLYASHHIDGSLIIESLEGKTKHRYNVNDQASFVPASTFKIPNTLIILEEGLIKGPLEIIKWDGKEREYAPWNQDQTLKSAFQYSCVWCYQRYALKVGDKKYRDYLRQFNYGNRLTGSDVTRFWLDGELRASTQDQIDFLRKLYVEDLPVQKAHIQTLKGMMLSDDNAGYKMWSKTGWSGKDGWFVGYLLADGQTWFFANHITINRNADLVFRKRLVLEAFTVLNIIQQ